MLVDSLVLQIQEYSQPVDAMHTFRAHRMLAVTIFYGTLVFIFTAIFTPYAT